MLVESTSFIYGHWDVTSPCVHVIIEKKEVILSSFYKAFTALFTETLATTFLCEKLHPLSLVRSHIAMKELFSLV